MNRQRLFFEDENRPLDGSPPSEAPAASGHNVRKSRRNREPVLDTEPTRDAPVNSLRFENEPDGSPPSEVPATSGHNVRKSKGGGKLRRETEKPRPSERLRHDDDGSRPNDEAPPPDADASAPNGDGAAAGGDIPRPDKKTVRESQKLNKSKLRMEKTEDKLSAARDKLAAQKPPKKPGPIKNAVQIAKSEAWVLTHGKIYQAEHENVGIKAAHRTELAGEGAVQGAMRFVKHRVRTRPARQVRRWERKDTKTRADYAFRTMARDNPDLKSNAVSRYMQKRNLRKQYQKQARDATKTTGTLARKTAAAIGNAGRAAVRVVAAHPASMMIALLFFILTVMMQSCVGGALTVGNGIIGAVSGTAYLAEDSDINAAELAYTEWETNLLLEAQNAETSHPGYDEYRYDIDAVGHDLYALISFLTTKYDNFTFSQVEPVLRDIFNQQYDLTFTEIVEVRYRTEYYTDDDGHERSREVAYNYYILQTTLTAQSFTDIIAPMLSAGNEQDRYDIYNITRGNRQYVGSPFPINWLPYVSCHFGYRVHPITGAQDFHRGIDIALPYGTNIYAGGDGVVVEATFHDLYGYTVKIDYGDGIAARYSHCSALLVSAGQTVQGGEVIARVGSTGASTGPHLDMEVLKNGELLNPLYFVVIPYN